LLTYRIDGEGEPVLLLNGGMMTFTAWEPIVAILDRSFQVVRCDFRGQLLSPGEPEPSLEAHVRDLVELLDGIELERVHVVGTSYGGLVGLLFAALHPERTASLTVIAATGRITPEFWESTARCRELALEAAAGGDGGRVLEYILPETYTPEYLKEQAKALEFHRRWVAALPIVWFRGVAAILASVEGVDLTPRLGDIRCPALIVAGERDLMFPLEQSRALAEAIPGARLEVVPGAPHGMVVENPDVTARLLLDFIAGASNA
jgi:3-oxoadipate enol-lactonase